MIHRTMPLNEEKRQKETNYILETAKKNRCNRDTLVNRIQKKRGQASKK